MDATDTGQLSRHPWVPRRKIDVFEDHRMGEAGILTDEDRVELIEGELVAMAPIGNTHAGTTNTLTGLLVLAVDDRAVVAVGNPVRLDNYSEPQPDFSLLRPHPDDYRSASPRPQDTLLVIEVSESSLNYDRRVKLSLYARHGIPEVWIVNLASAIVEIYHTPIDDDYTATANVDADGFLEPSALPGVRIPTQAFLS